VSARASTLRALRVALTFVAALAAGCERAGPSPSSPPVTPQPAAVERPSVADADAAAAASSARTFDVGVVKSAAEYLRDPEFANADLKRGQLLSLACAACHTFGAGEKPIVGPNLHGVFGRRAADVEGFDYSPALRASGLVWTPRALEAWLADPASFVAGTKMSFTGYRSAEDRRDLIAYLLHATQ